MDSGLINENVDQTEPEARPRQAWNSATDEQKLEYKNILELKLNQIGIPEAVLHHTLSRCKMMQ